MAKPKTFYIDIDLNNNALNNSVIGTFNASGVEGAFGYDTGTGLLNFIDATGIQNIATHQFVLDSFTEISAANGLTNDSGTLKLGGALTEDTVITSPSFSYTFSGNNTTMELNNVNGFYILKNFGEANEAGILVGALNQMFLTGAEIFFTSDKVASNDNNGTTIGYNNSQIDISAVPGTNDGVITIHSDNMTITSNEELNIRGGVINIDIVDPITTNTIGQIYSEKLYTEYQSLNGGIQGVYTNPNLGVVHYATNASLYGQNNIAYLFSLQYDQTFYASFPQGTGFTGQVYHMNLFGTDIYTVAQPGSQYNGNSIPTSGIFKMDYIGNFINAFDAFELTNQAIKTASRPTDSQVMALGYWAGGITLLNASDGTIDTSFDFGTGFDITPDDIAFQSDGKLIVVGSFSEYNGTPITGYIVRLNTDGTIDNTFASGTGFDNPPFIVKVTTTDSIIVGSDKNATQYDGVDIILGINKLNSDGTLDTTFITNFATSGYLGTFVTTSIDYVSGSEVIFFSGFILEDPSAITNVGKINADGTAPGGGWKNILIGAVVDVRVTANPNNSAIYIYGSEVESVNDIPLNGNNIVRADFYTGAINLDVVFTSSSVIQYTQDLSTKYTDRSLVDKAYVDGAAGNSITVSNGLTKSGSDISWGGAITNNVDLIPDLSSIRNISFGDNTLRISQYVVKSAYGEIITDGGSQSVYMTSRSDSTNKGRISVSANNSTITLRNFDNSETLSQFDMDGNNVVISGNASFQGLRYDSDISNNYINRSLVDKEYVDGLITGVANTFENALSNVSGNVKLGGLLTNDTVIGSTSNVDMTFLENVFGAGFDKVSIINVVKIQNDGRIILIGQFTINGGRNIVRLNADGTLDTTFNVGTGFNNGSNIRAIDIQDDNKITIGGEFDSYNGDSYTNIIRLNDDGSIDTSFVVGTGFNNTVLSILFLDFDYTLVAGDFTDYDGTSVGYIARLNNNDGSIDTAFLSNSGTGFNGTVNVLENQPGSGILVGGGFSDYNGTAAPNMIRLYADGNIDGSFSIGGGFDQDVYTIKYDGSNSYIYVGGAFTTFDGNSASHIVQLSSSGSHLVAFTTNITGGQVYSIDTHLNSIIVVGGDFSTVNGEAHDGIVKLNPNDGGIEEFEYNIGETTIDFSAVLSVVTVSNSTFFIGGFFKTIIPIPGVIKYQAVTPYDFIFATGQPIEYDKDYSLVYTNRSIVDKGYVYNENQALGLKKPVRAATTIEIDLVTGGALTIDGVLTVQGDRILVKDQTDTTTNGIYFVNESGQWVRSDVDDIALGLHVFVQEGTDNDNTGWLITSPDQIVLGSSPIQFIQFAGEGDSSSDWALAGTSVLTDDVVIDGNTRNLEINAADVFIHGTTTNRGELRLTNNTYSARVINTGTSDYIEFSISSTDVVFSTNVTAFAGLQYTDDHSANFTNRSLVDKAYVDTAIGVSKYVETITGDGVETSFIITHSLASYDVMVQVFQNTGNRSNVDVGVDRSSIDDVTIVFGIAPANGVEYRVLINKIN